ncbi:MAG: transketolase [Actinobacteria bacterium]|nr:transketolase [Actinomycetota bacterium]
MRKDVINKLAERANKIRQLILEMTTQAGSGHPGGSLSCADLIAAIYFHFLRHDPANPSWEERDRFILSKGHSAPALYAVLALSGYFPVEELMTLRKINSRLQGHPASCKTPGVEISTGSLGQGLSVACGIALGIKLSGGNAWVYVLLGDGELNEGQVWEAALFANQYRLSNIIGIIDRNGFQVDGPTTKIINTEPLSVKWKVFGWHAQEIDGHNMVQIVNSLDKAIHNQSGPHIIIANTVKGKGVSFLEHNNEYHGKALNQEQLHLALSELKKKSYGI